MAHNTREMSEKRRPPKNRNWRLLPADAFKDWKLGYGGRGLSYDAMVLLLKVDLLKQARLCLISLFKMQ